ncbi:MAG: RluA family pseudouridine synthase [Oscillospiraceae bacterium]|jgi:23S rRNA pseudouridine1911/1915/1917 synthase|nr:RluA family pseudouridine synthase [Oscillospiraceae bacterium]
MTRTYLVTPEESGERIDALLPRHIEGLSRSQAARLFESGAVLLREKAVRKNYRVSGGEFFTIELPEPEDTSLSPENIPLDIVYEDDDLIVVNKPKGLVVHPAPGHSGGTLVNALLYHCGESLSGIGGEKRPGIVHRIDKDTSGLIIAAKNDFAHRKLAAQLSDHSLSRTYEALVLGSLREDSGTINAPIGRSQTDRKKMAVTERNSRAAVTHYEVIARHEGFTHIRCKLETGRTHQIRVHLASLGHPVLGDPLYCRQKPPKGLEGQCLHARELRFVHPRTGEEVVVECGIPEYFRGLIEN